MVKENILGRDKLYLTRRVSVLPLYLQSILTVELIENMKNVEIDQYWIKYQEWEWGWHLLLIFNLFGNPILNHIQQLTKRILFMVPIRRNKWVNFSSIFYLCNSSSIRCHYVEHLYYKHGTLYEKPSA